MALTCCMNCEKSYLENFNKCPFCNEYNFLCSDEILPEVVKVLCNNIKKQRQYENKQKLKALSKYNPSGFKKTISWMMEKLIFSF